MKRDLLPALHRCLQLKRSAVHERVSNATSQAHYSHTHSLSHTLTLQQSQCSPGLTPVTLPTSVPFKFGLHVKVLHVQDQIHVVLSAQVRARGGIHTELEKGPSRKSSLRGPWQKAQGADRGRPERPLREGACRSSGMSLNGGKLKRGAEPSPLDAYRDEQPPGGRAEASCDRDRRARGGRRLEPPPGWRSAEAALACNQASPVGWMRRRQPGRAGVGRCQPAEANRCRAPRTRPRPGW